MQTLTAVASYHRICGFDLFPTPTSGVHKNCSQSSFGLYTETCLPSSYDGSLCFYSI